MQPVGYVRSTRSAVHDDDWDAETTSIVLNDDFDPAALSGLTDFSHVEVIFVFDQVTAEQIERGTRHPRGREDWPLVGIFAQRGKNRPNRLGLTTCAVLGVDGRELPRQRTRRGRRHAGARTSSRGWTSSRHAVSAASRRGRPS